MKLQPLIMEDQEQNPLPNMVLRPRPLITKTNTIIQTMQKRLALTMALLQQLKIQALLMALLLELRILVLLMALLLELSPLIQAMVLPKMKLPYLAMEPQGLKHQ
jgi:hypothetical protein